MEVTDVVYRYADVPTVYAFTVSRKRIKCIMGPFGSGKSSGCVMALIRYATEQVPDEQGIRHTRYAVVRNTIKELKDTTKKTIDEWISYLKPTWRESENKFLIEFKLKDGTVVKSEWLLRALDRPEQVKDLLSLELSGAWLNEAREVPKEVYDMLDGRIDRYPRRRGNYKCSYPFIILDTNPPDTDNWIYHHFEELPQRDPRMREVVEMFKQPSGLSKEAENIANLPENYYYNLMAGKDADYIKVYIQGEYGYLREGKPVFPNFSHSLHVALEELLPIKGVMLTIGMDFGLFPAAVITQLTPNGQCRVLDEIVSEEASDLEEFTKTRLRPLLSSDKYRRFPLIVIGDPAGVSRSQLDSRTCFGILRKYGIKAYPAYTNTLQPRLQAVNQYLTRLISGKPACQISPECKVVIRALAGHYKFRKLRLSGDRYAEVPDKNQYSHTADALQYACLGYSPGQQERAQERFEYGDLGGFEPSRDSGTNGPLIIPL